MSDSLVGFSPQVGDTENIVRVKSLYLALTRRDMAAVRLLLVAEPVWDVCPGCPDGGIYKGFEAVFGKLYPALFSRFFAFSVSPQGYFDSGDVVSVLGDYHVVAREGEALKQIRFVHIFTIESNGLIAMVRQVADSALF